MLGVILAAGKGTRLKELGKNLPKALLPIGEKTCLEHIILGMKGAGIRRIAVVIGHLGEMIEERYGQGESLGVEINYLEQDLSIYGTGRAVLLAKELAGKDPLMVSYGDILIESSNYKTMVELARQEQTSVSSANWIEDPTAGAAVYFSKEGLLEKIVEKPPKGTSTTNWNNAGVYVFQPLVFDYLAKLSKSPRGEYELSEAVRQMMVSGVPIKVHKITGFWQDIGTPEDVAAIRHLLE
ncbi:MAG TPA: nucleotidyltransferase family protein [Limnochordia bacterium]|nr:nucleotidyltransferase family protein [Limnochordia bacterium]